MVEVADDNNRDEDEDFWAGKVPGEDDEPDLGMPSGGADAYGEEEELVPVKRKHGGLFGADLSSVKY